MRALIRVLIILVIFSSCSTYRRSMIVSSASGCISGGYVGHVMAPGSSKNKNANGLIGCAIGGALMAGVSHFLWNDNPLNQKIPDAKIEEIEKEEKNRVEADLSDDGEIIGLGNIKGLKIKSTGQSTLPNVDIPLDAIGVFPKAIVIEKEIPPQKIGNIYIPKAFKAYEYKVVE